MRNGWEAISGIIMGGLGAVPLLGARLLVISILVALAVWAMSMPKPYAFKGAPDREWWRDVRLWAAAIILLQIIPYLIFF